MKVIVRDLAYNVREEELRNLFGTVGEVVSVSLPVDHISGQIEGAAVVEMASRAEAEDAVRLLHHQPLHGRRMRVRLAEEHELSEEAQPMLVDEAQPATPHPQTLPHRPERSPGR